MRQGRSRAIGLLLIGLIIGIDSALASSRLYAEDKRMAIGQPAGLLEFKDIRYLPRSLDDFGAKSAYAIVFVNTTCPVAQRYLPKLNELNEAFKAKNVQFLALYVGAGESVAEMAEHALDYRIGFPVGRDFDAKCARSLGVRRTPEVVVLDRDRKLRYRGRIDDQFRLGGERATPASDELRNALEDILERRDLRVAETVVDGCKIAFPTKSRSLVP